MDFRDLGKGNLLISYLFTENNACKNIDNEQIMQNELQELVESWKAKGYIKRYVIAPDDVIKDSLKDNAYKKLESKKE